VLQGCQKRPYPRYRDGKHTVRSIARRPNDAAVRACAGFGAPFVQDFSSVRRFLTPGIERPS
jgi:hypothetical protein